MYKYKQSLTGSYRTKRTLLTKQTNLRACIWEEDCLEVSESDLLISAD